MTAPVVAPSGGAAVAGVKRAVLAIYQKDSFYTEMALWRSSMFEFDPDKSGANNRKHGIDFEEARALWLDERRIDLGNVEFMSGRSTSDAGRRSSPSATTESESSPSVVRDSAKKWPTSTAEFDEMFDNGEDIDHLIDWSSARVIGAEAKRVNVDFPAWMVRSLDRHAKKHGVTRQALIKMWLADRLEAAG